MPKNTLEELQSITAEVKLPSHVKEAVLKKAESSPRQTDQQHTLSHPITRRRFIYAGGIAAAAGTIFIGLRILRSFSRENSFVLKAYAEGIKGDGSASQANHTVLMPAKTIGTWGSFSSEDNPLLWSISHTMDLSCNTVQVKQLDYSLAGDYVPPDNSVSADNEDDAQERIFFDSLVNDSTEGEYAGISSSSFSVTLSDKTTGEKNNKEGIDFDGAKDITRNLTVYFHDDEELQALSNQVKDLHIADFPEGRAPEALLRQQEHLANKMLLIAEKHFSEILSKTEIVIAATFTDESTQSKSYIVKPVQDFDQLCLDWLESFVDSNVALNMNRNDEAAQAKRDELYATPPQLYTVTELS